MSGDFVRLSRADYDKLSDDERKAYDVQLKAVEKEEQSSTLFFLTAMAACSPS